MVAGFSDVVRNQFFFTSFLFTLMLKPSHQSRNMLRNRTHPLLLIAMCQGSWDNHRGTEISGVFCQWIDFLAVMRLLNVSKSLDHARINQYYVVFLDLFQPVFSSAGNDMVVDAICNQVIESIWDICAENEFIMDGKSIYFSPSLECLALWTRSLR